MTFRWDPPADDGGAPVTDYAYRYDANEDGVFVRWAYVGSTPRGQPPRRSWGIDVDADGDRVCVQVMAVNVANFQYVPELRNLEGEPTQARCAVPYGPAEGAPEAPGWLRVTSTQADRAELEWDEPDESGSSPLWGYRIEVSTDGGDNWREVEANTGTPALSWSDAGVADLASRLYRVSAVNTDERVGRRSPWARLAPMTLKEHLRPRAHQHFENAGDLVASSHSVTVAVELANPAPGRRVHVRIVTQGVLVATQVHEPEGTGFTATFGGPEEDGYALEPQTYYTVQADVVAGFDSDRRVEGATFTLPDIRQGGAAPGRGVEVDTDGDGVAEADPRLTVAMGAAATFRVRPGACAGAKTGRAARVVDPVRGVRLRAAVGRGVAERAHVDLRGRRRSGRMAADRADRGEARGRDAGRAVRGRGAPRRAPAAPGTPVVGAAGVGGLSREAGSEGVADAGGGEGSRGGGRRFGPPAGELGRGGGGRGLPGAVALGLGGVRACAHGERRDVLAREAG